MKKLIIDQVTLMACFVLSDFLVVQKATFYYYAKWVIFYKSLEVKSYYGVAINFTHVQADGLFYLSLTNLPLSLPCLKLESYGSKLTLFYFHSLPNNHIKSFIILEYQH